MSNGAALVSVEQFQIRLGRDVLDEEVKRVEAILEDTSVIAMSAARTSWAPEQVPSDVAAVVLSAALRTFKNPDRYVQQQIGDYSARVDRSEFANGLFTKAELDILERNSESNDLDFGSFGTVERVRDESWSDNRVRYWETNRPSLPRPYSAEVDW
ncbi:hypothetical protein [Corynebacterium accolens]|uniref:hypothetical protein n=1 Tax=Corynebacterium accolens TaxID=38284 RepID=UPI00266ECE55|nr:hypothetical protein [Corynebacterium accolens]WKS54907.1 hypothetical protein NLL31_06660 [Corynebacterium accolens]